MIELHQTIVLIPVYLPAPGLVELVRALAAHALQTLIVIDGMNEADPAIVAQLRTLPGCGLISHWVNMGKGRALKSGMNHVLANMPEIRGIITADADGQHCVKDILKVARSLAQHPDRMTIGYRAMTGRIPLRSSFGNAFTRISFRLFTGKPIRDAQSGLRGFPIGMIPELLTLRGERYDFELSVLIHVYSRHPVEEIPIETIYAEGNRTSFFKPLRDSALIYYTFLKFAISSITAAIIDFLFFGVAWTFTGDLLASLLVGRMISGTYNFSVNRFLVFNADDQSHLVAITKYVCAVVLSMFISYFAISGLATFVGLNIYIAKVIAETAVFLFNFHFQRSFVFPRGRG